MKTYINSEGIKSHFIGVIPDGWREMAAEEIAQEEAQAAAIKTIQDELTAIYNNATPLQRSKYRTTKEDAEKHLAAGEIAEFEALLAEAASDLPEPEKTVAQAIYDKFIKLKGE